MQLKLENEIISFRAAGFEVRMPVDEEHARYPRVEIRRHDPDTHLTGTRFWVSWYEDEINMTTPERFDWR